MEAYLKTIKGQILCRKTEIQKLFALIGAVNEPLPQSIFIYGHIATGKSLIIESLLSYLRYNVSIINCIEHQKIKHVYEYVLNDLSPEDDESNPDLSINYKCDNIMDFIINLKKIPEYDNRPIIIVLDKCDRLRDINVNFLSAFLRLRELSGVNICTIFMSDIIWEKYYAKIGLADPIKIHFPQYVQEEMAQILLLHKPNDYDDAFYKTYLNLFLSVYYRFCRDLNELRYMAKKNFNKYIEPIKNNQLTVSDVTGLWRNISSTLKTNLEVIYLRVSTEDFVQSAHMANEIESTTKLALSFELPFYAKYMLIAAYLASHNSPKDDKRLFMKYTAKRHRKTNKGKKVTATYTSNTPRNFAVTRMLAIFCSILEENVDLNVILLTHVSTMCHLGLLTAVGANNLDEPKFKCCVNQDFIIVIGKTVGFDVNRYLPEKVF